MTSDKNNVSVGLVSTQYLTLDLPDSGLALENGGVLSEITVAYETYGERNAQRDNTILICHALTGDAHVAGWHDADNKNPGWWDEMVGPGKSLDTNHFHIVCSNLLGSCNGTTGPSS